MESKYTIYSATSLDTGKKYIGCTSLTLEKRKAYHIADSKKKNINFRFYKALKQFDYNFEWEILEEGLSQKDAHEREKFYIQKFNTFHDGYNCTYGGNGFTGTIEGKNSIIKNLKKYHENPETRLKHSLERGGGEVFVFETNGTFLKRFDTQIDCCEELGVLKPQVCYCLKGKRKSHKGFVFSKTKEFPFKITNYDYVKRNPILVYKNGQYIGSWDSEKSCAKDLSISRGQIRWMIQGKLKSPPKHPYTFLKGGI